MTTFDRCQIAIAVGPTLHTRCDLAHGHVGMHEGPGLAQYSYQRISWLKGDRREYVTERADTHAWEVAS